MSSEVVSVVASSADPFGFEVLRVVLVPLVIDSAANV